MRSLDANIRKQDGCCLVIGLPCTGNLGEYLPQPCRERSPLHENTYLQDTARMPGSHPVTYAPGDTVWGAPWGRGIRIPEGRVNTQLHGLPCCSSIHKLPVSIISGPEVYRFHILRCVGGPKTLKICNSCHTANNALQHKKRPM